MNNKPPAMNHDLPESLQFVTTADGSKTIFNAAVGENYHSRHGALQESKHVFLTTGLIHWLETNLAESVTVLEVGFGTGLNFLLTADYCLLNNIHLDYTGIEAYPLSEQMISRTGYEEYISAATRNSFLEQYTDSLDHMVNLNAHCQLRIVNCKLNNFNFDQLYDVIYYDAFAAAYQPEMWTDQAIQHAAGFMQPDGIFVTYAITGNLKRLFKGLGFKVEKAPGAAGKREMLRVTKPFFLG